VPENKKVTLLLKV